MNWVDSLGVFFAASAWLFFLGAYTFRARWWKGPIGRNVFWVSTLMVLVLVRITLVIVWPELRNYDWLTNLFYVLVGLGAVDRTRLMFKAQREGERGVEEDVIRYGRRKTDDPKIAQTLRDRIASGDISRPNRSEGTEAHEHSD